MRRRWRIRPDRVPRWRAAVLALLAVLALTSCGVTRGEDSGVHRLRMMIPNSPGGGYDVTGRTAVKVTEGAGLTQRVQVFNVIGAGGTVAMARLMNEEGNGDLVMTMGLGVVGATFTNKSEARVSQATPIARLIQESEGVFVPADSPYQTIEDLVAAWKADPAGLSVGGGSSPGGPDHLMPMQLAETVGLDPTTVNYISYDGGGELLPALLGSKVAFATSGLGEYTEQISAGQVRVLAVSGEEQVPGIDAPTLQESGIDLVFTNWRGILAPPGITDEQQAALIKIFTDMHASAEWQQALETNGWTDAFITGDEFGTFLTEQDERVSSTLTRLGLA
jgi:putative tricarboxylic transport membrane protein